MFGTVERCGLWPGAGGGSALNLNHRLAFGERGIRGPVAGWGRVGLLGVWFGVFGRVGLGVGVWFGLLTLGLCGGVSSGWCRLAGGSGKGSQGAECGVELCCPGPAGGVSQGGCA